MDNKETINGVKCVVNTCEYNRAGNFCTAGSIEILPRNATTSEDTDCGTFRSNEK